MESHFLPAEGRLLDNDSTNGNEIVSPGLDLAHGYAEPQILLICDAYLQIQHEEPTTSTDRCCQPASPSKRSYCPKTPT